MSGLQNKWGKIGVILENCKGEKAPHWWTGFLSPLLTVHIEAGVHTTDCHQQASLPLID